MPAITHVFTLARVAQMLGEDEDFLHDATIEMEPENGVTAAHGTGDEYTPAFTDFGVESLRQLIPLYREN